MPTRLSLAPSPSFPSPASLIPTDDPDSDGPLLTLFVPCLPFGKVASVTNFNSVMEFSTFVCSSLLLTPTDHMFDDVPTVDRAGFSTVQRTVAERVLQRYGKTVPVGRAREAAETWEARLESGTV